MKSNTALKKQQNSLFDQWFDIHFGDTSFNGRAVIGRRKPQDEGIKTVAFRSLTELRSYVKLISTSTKSDYYITANTVMGKKRIKDQLFGLQNIVIDIDCHSTREITALTRAFIWRSKRDLWDTGVIPTPNTIIHTGRGIQLWWALVPCYGGRDYDISRFYHDQIKTNLLNHIEAMFDEYVEELEGLSVDRGASINPVGYFRLPGTYNTKTKSYGSIEVLHTKRYDQRDLIKMDKPTLETRSKVARGVKKPVPMQETDRLLLRNIQYVGARRVMQLINLRNLRDNEVGSEMRDYFNFSVYNALRMSFDHQKAMVRLAMFNAGFKQPMSESELENCVCSAKEIDGYKYTNEKLIELLEITPEEQSAIGLFPYTRKWRSKPNASRDAVRAALREDRDQKILKLTEDGISQAETARILGIGKNTVGRVLKRLRDESEMDTTEVVTEDSSRHQNGSIYVTARANRVLPRTATEAVYSEIGGLFVMPEEDSS
jgi:transcription initiation factor IIE alpha subunit